MTIARCSLGAPFEVPSTQDGFALIRSPPFSPLAAKVSRLLDFSRYSSRQPLKLCFYPLESVEFVNRCINQYSRILFHNPFHTTALFNRALLYLFKEQYGMASEDIEALLSINKLHAGALSLKGYLCQNNNDLVKALACYKLSYSINPKDPVNLFRYANALHLTGDAENSNKRFKECLEIVNATIEARNNDFRMIHIRAQANWMLGSKSEAYADFEILLRRYPKNISYTNAFVQLLLEMNRVWEAIDQLKILIEVSPYDPKAYLMLGKAFKNLYNIPQALAAFNEGLKVDPTNKSLLFESALTHIQQDKPAQARPYIERLEEYYPDFPEKLLLSGERHFTNGKVKESIECFSSYLKNNPDAEFSALGFYLNAKALSYIENSGDAINNFTCCIIKEPCNFAAHFLRGCLLQKIAPTSKNPTEFYQQAYSSFHECVKYLNIYASEDYADLNCNSLIVLRTWAHLAAVYARLNPNNTSFALEIMENVLEYPAATADFEITMNHARIYLAMKDQKALKELYEKAAKQDPRSEEARLHLYQCCIQLKEFGQAQLVAAELIQLAPNNKNYSELKQSAHEKAAPQKETPSSAKAPKKLVKTKKPNPPYKRDDFAHQDANLPKPEIIIGPKELEREERIKEETERIERKRAEETARLKAEKEVAKLSHRPHVSSPKINTRGKEPLSPQELFRKQKEEMKKLEAKALREASRGPIPVSPPLSVEMPAALPEPITVQIYRNIHPARTANREFDPSLEVPGEFRKKEQAVQAALPTASKIDKTTAPKKVHVAFMNDNSLERLQAAFEALQMIEILLPQGEAIRATLVENLKILMNALSTTSRSSFGINADFDVMANQVLVSTTAAERLRIDISSYHSFLEFFLITDFCKKILATDLKSRLQELSSNQSAWHPKPGESSTLLSDIDLVSVQFKVHVAKAVQS